MLSKFDLVKRGRTLTLWTPSDVKANVSFCTQHFGHWEETTYDVLDAHLPPMAPGTRSKKAFVDIGAWIGPLTVHVAKSGYDVYAIEPDPNALLALERGVESNGISDRVTIIRAAVSDRAGTVSFGKNQFLHNPQLGDSTSQIQNPFGIYSSDSSIVPAITVNQLERLCGDFDRERVGLIKIDIEGGEQRVMMQLLEKCASKGIPIYVSFHLSWWIPSGPIAWNDETKASVSMLYPSVDLSPLETDPFASILFAN